MHAGNHETSFRKKDLILSIYSGSDVICLVFSPTFFFSHYVKSHIALQKGKIFFKFQKMGLLRLRRLSSFGFTTRVPDPGSKKRALVIFSYLGACRGHITKSGTQHHL